MDSNGFQSAYSESCSALFAVAPSSGRRGIVTVDRTGSDGYGAGDCTNTFGGTSSSAPLAAGAIALLLQLRPELTWRDVQHVIARGATKINIGDPSYGATNARGYLHSERYGFGNLVLPQLVATAKAHQLVPAQRLLCQVSLEHLSLKMSPRLNVTLECPEVAGSFVEHVELVIGWTHSCRGKASFGLVSQGGKTSHLAVEHAADCASGTTSWPFRSVAHWGETLSPTWILMANDPTQQGQLLHLQLSVWGH